jgi:HPt (histidine-containing phosphotransfer) domain-containing protein
MINREKFNENFQYFDKDIITEIIDIFLSEYDARYTAIAKDIEAKDFVKLKFDAHSLKGVIANFMDPVTIELSRQLDEMTKIRQEAGLSELYADLLKASDALKEELIAIRKEINS